MYLIGEQLVFELFNNKDLILSENESISVLEIWKYVSLFHDIGYGKEYQIKGDDSYNPNVVSSIYFAEILDIKNTTNNQWCVSYSVNQLMAYYAYTYQYYYNFEVSYAKNEHHEHGILGGLLVSKLLRNNEPHNSKSSNRWKSLILGVSLTIAQHNIWPFEENERCKLSDYKLIFDSYGVNYKEFGHFKAGQLNDIDLLSFLLCLSDSIERLKNFYNDENVISCEYKDLVNDIANNFSIDCHKQRNNFFIKLSFQKCKSNKEFKTFFKKYLNKLKGAKRFLNLRIKTCAFKKEIIVCPKQLNVKWF